MDETSDTLAKTSFTGVSLKQWSGAKVSAPTKPRSPSLSSTHSPTSAGTDLDTFLNVSIQLLNLEDQQCSQKTCSGNGHCVDIQGVVSCVCSEGYSGDSCQDDLTKATQGPIIYGMVGLCAGVVVIAVIAVVVKRKSAASRLLMTLFFLKPIIWSIL